MDIIDGNSLTPAQYRALGMILAGKSPSDVATELGIGTRTLDRWRAMPDFQALLKQASYLCLQESISVLAAGATAASYELLRIIQTGDSERNRLKAIEILFDVLGKGTVDVSRWSPQAHEYQQRLLQDQQVQQRIFN